MVAQSLGCLQTQVSGGLASFGSSQLSEPGAALGQATPQPPQLLESASASQPSSATVPGGFTQLTFPHRHVETQSPLLHSALITPFCEHARPQAPQFSGSTATWVSQPGAPGMQSVYPGLHTSPHRAEAQLGVAFGPPGHTVPQFPQCSGFVWRSTHWPPQLKSGGAQLATQLPFWQTLPETHRLPQEPQFCGSMSVFTHPFPHLVNEPLHSKVQVPEEQTG